MKKLLRKKDKKDKKDKKKESKMSKKGQHSDSSTSLDSQKSSDSLTVAKTTSASNSPRTEIKTVTMETIKDEEGAQAKMTTKVVEEKSVKPTANGQSVVKTTTSTTITKSEPNPSNKENTSSIEKTTTTTMETNLTEATKPIETTTVVKETTIVSPRREEKIVVSQTSSEVESIPTTREFLEKSFAKSGMDEQTRSLASRFDNDDSDETEKSFQSSEITTVSELSDGSNTVKTVTNVVSDETGTWKTTTITSSGDGIEDNIVCSDSNRQADLPDWLEMKEDNCAPKGTAVIDSDIEIPSPILDRKETKHPDPSQPVLTGCITPSKQEKEDVSLLLENLSESNEEKTKIERKSSAGKTDDNVEELIDDLESAPELQTAPTTQAAPPAASKSKDQASPAEQFPLKTQSAPVVQDKSATQAEPQQQQPSSEATPKTDNSVVELIDSLESTPDTQAAPTTQAAPQATSTPKARASSTEQLTSNTPNAPKVQDTHVQRPSHMLHERKKPTQEKMLQDRKVKRFVKDGEVFETITETFKHPDGKLETTTTTRKGNQPKDIVDLNANMLKSEPIKGTEKKKKYEEDDPFVHDGEVVNPEEVFEEILVVERKRKVRFPKSFLPRSPERPKSWGLPLDLLIERQKSSRRSAGFIYGREVNERVQQTSQKDPMGDTKELDRLLAVIEAAN